MGTFLSKNNENDGKEKGETPRDNEEDYEESEHGKEKEEKEEKNKEENNKEPEIFGYIMKPIGGPNVKKFVLSKYYTENLEKRTDIAILQEKQGSFCLYFSYENQTRNYQLSPEDFKKTYDTPRSAYYDSSLVLQGLGRLGPKLLVFQESDGCIKYLENGNNASEISFKEIDLLTRKYNTYVHENAFSTNIPWFKEHSIENASASTASKNFDPHFVANDCGSYLGSFMAPMVILVGIFVGKYFYRKFMRKCRAKKKQML